MLAAWEVLHQDTKIQKHISKQFFAIFKNHTAV